MLCDQCRNIDFSSSVLLEEPQPEFYALSNIPDSEQPSDRTRRYYSCAHSPSVKFLKSAAQGCHLCFQALHSLQEVGLQLDSPHDYHDGPVDVRWYPHHQKMRNGVRQVEVYIVAKTGLRNIKAPFVLAQYGDERPSRVVGTGSDLESILISKSINDSHSTGCAENFLLASLWIRTCLSSHALCTVATPLSPSLPTRVLDVDADGTLSRIRLVAGAGRYGRYVTLSHVWGKARIITSTLATIEDRRKGISLEELSNTFRDAVFIARQMSVRYLWIDSLCIIQDSSADWSSEAARMGQYYSSSLFTIAAVSGVDGKCGIIVDRDPRRLCPHLVTVKFPKSAEGGLGSTARLSGFIHPAFDWDPARNISQYQIHRPPLWQRAWVVQERMLSPRLLMFSDAQMSWMCHCEESSECAPEGRARSRDLSAEERERQAVLLGLKTYHARSSDNETGGHEIEVGTDAELVKLYNSWYDLVIDYTKCGLTVVSDIFPAISGIAAAYARATGDDYVAGAWRRDLHRGLLWSAVDSTKAKFDLRRYRAPSWSWASLPGTCGFITRQNILNDVNTGHFEIISVKVAGDQANPLGEVRSGFILAAGLLKKAHPAPADAENQEEIFTNIRSPRHSGNLFDLEGQRPLGWYIPDNQDRENLTEVWCAPVCSAASALSTEKGEKRDWYCLAMLDLGARDGAPIFMRVGIAWVKETGWFRDCEKRQFSVI